MKNQAKTWNSQQSDIDPYSRLQNSFLQKFVKYMLIDHFDEVLSNIFENTFKRKLPDRSSKTLAQDLFLSQKSIKLDDLTSILRSFMLSKSPSFASGQLSKLVEAKYYNRPAEECAIKRRQLVFVEVCIRADIQRIEQVPSKMQKMLNAALSRAVENPNCPLVNLLQNYKEQYLTFLILYYGECNFELIRKQNYQKQEISICGRIYKLRIMVVFISKVGLMETFKNLSKVPHLEYVNTEIIEFYQIKREKNKRKKTKQNEAKAIQKAKLKKRSNSILKDMNYKTMVGIAMVGVGMAVLVRKIFA